MSISRNCVSIIATTSLVLFASISAKSDLAIPARSIPSPAAASGEYRDLVDGVESLDQQIAAPNSIAQWIRLVEQLDSLALENTDRLAATYRTTIDEIDMAGTTVYRVTPNEVRRQENCPIVVFVHGGAHVFGGGRSGLAESIVLADRFSLPVLSIDYGMPPDAPFPMGLNEVTSVLNHITAEVGESTRIALGGNSSGAALAVAAVQQLIKDDAPTPDVLFLASPWADLSKTGDTFFTNEGIDRIIVRYEGLLASAANLYGGSRPLTDPKLSPLYGSFTGFPPTILISGTRDLFLSDTVRLHRRLRAAGVASELHVFEAFSHSDHSIAINTPESDEAYAEMLLFTLGHLR